MKNIKYASLLLTVSIFLCACSSPQKSASYMENSTGREQYDTVGEEAAAYPQENIGEAAEKNNLSTDMGYAGEAKGNQDVFEVQNPSRKLVKTVEVSLESKEFDKQLNSITEEVTKYKGYIEYSDIRKNSILTPDYNYERNSVQNTLQSANLTARIPADKLNSFVDFLAKNTNMLSKIEYVDDVTLHYIDMESRKKSLEVERQALWTLMENADSIDSIIAIQTRLSVIRAEIENYESQLRFFDNQVDYSTVNINLSEVKDYQAPPAEGFQERITAGLKESLKNFKNSATELLIFIIINSPFILTAIIVILILILIIKRSGKKRIKNKKGSSDKTEKPVQNASTTSISNQSENPASIQRDTEIPKKDE